MRENYEEYKCMNLNKYSQCKTCDSFGINDSYRTEKCYQPIKDYYDRMMENK